MLTPTWLNRLRLRSMMILEQVGRKPKPKPTTVWLTGPNLAPNVNTSMGTLHVKWSQGTSAQTVLVTNMSQANPPTPEIPNPPASPNPIPPNQPNLTPEPPTPPTVPPTPDRSRTIDALERIVATVVEAGISYAIVVAASIPKGWVAPLTVGLTVIKTQLARFIGDPNKASIP